MSSDADSKPVVSVHADSVDDFIVAAHDEQGRPGVFVAAALTDVHDDAAAELLRQNVATLRNYLAHTPAPRRGAQRAALAASFLASTLLVMSARPQAAAADTPDRLEVPWPHGFQVDMEHFGRTGELRIAANPEARTHITLESSTGPVEYTLPLPLDETLSSSEVGVLLSPTRRPNRTIAQHRREHHELLGVKIGNQYRYPSFQIDGQRRQIRPEVMYANTRLEAGADPWGALDWWYSPDPGLDDRLPVDVATRGELTQEMVDFALRLAGASME